LAEAELATLDVYEGKGREYERRTVQVRDAFGIDPSLRPSTGINAMCWKVRLRPGYPKRMCNRSKPSKRLKIPTPRELRGNWRYTAEKLANRSAILAAI